ncbi:MAG: alanine racemase [Candidatus Sericytochromatia bacterium]
MQPELAHTLLQRFGSPLYVYTTAGLAEAYAAFAGAFSYAPCELHYAIVCNSNPHLVNRLYRLGAGVHANTPGDAWLALQAGVPATEIMYSGTNLNAEDLDFLLAQGIALNLDSLQQVAAVLAHPRCPAQLGLRYLIDEPDKGNRIGVDATELQQALDLCTAAGVELAGLHMYAGTNNLSAERFLACFERLAQAAESLPRLAYLNLGGGYGIAYQPGQRPLELEAIGHRVCERMEAISRVRGHRVRLILEPGRFLVGNAGCLLTTVVSVKQRAERRFVGVDTTVGNIVVPSVYHPYHGLEALTPRGEALALPTDVCGNTTHSRDFIGRNLQLPELEPGDVLVLRDVGAYAYAMSSHFLNRPRPAEVVLDGDAVHLSRRRETWSDLAALQAGEPLAESAGSMSS